VSLLQGLAIRVHAVGDGLPIGQVHAAADRLRTATGLLAATLHESAPTPLLVAAGDHLDVAAGALHRARDELDRYLAAVGLATAVPVPAAAAGGAVDRPPVESFSFWADRIDVLTDRRGTPRPERREDSTVDGLLVEAVRRAQAGDRAGLREALAAAPATTGLALAPLAAELLRERAGTGFAAVRRSALARVADLLPGLDPATPLEVLTRALRRPVPPRDPDADGPAHPVDPAVVGPVLLAGLLAGAGAGAGDLARDLTRRRGGA
jgi:hypothetical protein